jgi:hypothetical protein
VRIRRFAIVGLVALFAWAGAEGEYFVKADMVRGAQGAQGAVCVPNSVFVPGEMIVFRTVVYDAATGEEMLHDEIAARGIEATVHIQDVATLPMFFPPASEGMGPGMYFFRGPFTIPGDIATGVFDWWIEVKDAAGGSATFSPIGREFGAGQITIQAAQ